MLAMLQAISLTQSQRRDDRRDAKSLGSYREYRSEMVGPAAYCPAVEPASDVD